MFNNVKTVTQVRYPHEYNIPITQSKLHQASASAFDNKSLYFHQFYEDQGFSNSYASIKNDLKPYSAQIPACNNYINLRPIASSQQPQSSQKSNQIGEKKNSSLFNKIKHKFSNMFSKNNKSSNFVIEDVKSTTAKLQNIIPLDQTNFYSTANNNLRNNNDMLNVNNNSSHYKSVHASHLYPNNTPIYSTHASLVQPTYYQDFNKYIF